jgi:hypothetical protein
MKQPQSVVLSRMGIRLFAAAICLAGVTLAQTESPAGARETTPANAKRHSSAKHDLASGAGDIGKGAAKGAGSAAKGAGKTAADLVTLHPINAGIDAGRGVAGTGKNVGVGAVKGSTKILRGTGKAIKHVL